MTTPSEKAKELMDKLIAATLKSETGLNYDLAKACALICVDEIITSMGRQRYEYGQ